LSSTVRPNALCVGPEHVTDVCCAVYNEENQSSKAIIPVYDQLAQQLSRANKITFAKVSVKKQAQIAESYNITNTPTFIIFKNGQQIRKFSGSNPQHLSDAGAAVVPGEAQVCRGDTQTSQNRSMCGVLTC
jgi:thioredoxin-like negative regulator of GroEL